MTETAGTGERTTDTVNQIEITSEGFVPVRALTPEARRTGTDICARPAFLLCVFKLSEKEQNSLDSYESSFDRQAFDHQTVNNTINPSAQISYFYQLAGI